MAVSAPSPPPHLLARAFTSHPIAPPRIPTSSNLFSHPSKPSALRLRAPPRRSSAVAFARRRRYSSSTARKETPKRKNNGGEAENVDEDAFEALFSQLEEDLKNENLLDDDEDDDDDDEITEDDLARLEEELVGLLGDENLDESDDDLDEVPGASSSDSDDEEDKEEILPKLKNWQLKRLAHALKVGRRKTTIKSLSAELGLDRALVLELLREPPPNLLLMCASLPDEVVDKPHDLESEPVESPITTTDVAESKAEARVPVHVMQSRWSMQKRLKKVQVETLERVYSRTKRPTNTMVSSIVHVTNLPRKRVVKWFEEKRVEDGVPDIRAPFKRSTPKISAR